MKVLDHGYVHHIESWGHGSADQPEAVGQIIAKEFPQTWALFEESR